jgi:DNA-binding NarL/FixJ family response regulator
MDLFRLMIVADDPLVRAGLTQLMADLSECLVDGQYSSAELINDLESGLGYPSSDAVLWDWGGDNGTLAQELMLAGLPIVALPVDKMGAAEAWHAGVTAVLSRGSSAERLLDAARAARRGLIVIDPELELDLSHSGDPVPSSISEELTPRELDVLGLLAEGLTNRAIAQRLSISEHTVKFHVNAVMSKFGSQNRTEAVVQATRQGLISL